MDVIDLDKVLDEFEASEAHYEQPSLLLTNGFNHDTQTYEHNLKLDQNTSESVELVIIEPSNLDDSSTSKSVSVKPKYVDDMILSDLILEPSHFNFPEEQTRKNSVEFEKQQEQTPVDFVSMKEGQKILLTLTVTNVTEEVSEKQVGVFPPMEDVEYPHQVHSTNLNQSQNSTSLNQSQTSEPIGFTHIDDDLLNDDEYSEAELEKYLADVKLLDLAAEEENVGQHFEDDVNNVPLSEELAQSEFDIASSHVTHCETELTLVDDRGQQNTTASEDLDDDKSRDNVDVSTNHVDDEYLELVDVVEQPEVNANAPGVGEACVATPEQHLEPRGSLEVVVPPPATGNNVETPAHSRSKLVTVTTIDEVGSSYKPTESELQLGKNAPVWIPDQDTPVCMLCEAKFNVIKRRHHCRACGRVLCADCCSLKAKLSYMENKEVRICSSCLEMLKKIENYEKSLQQTQADVPAAVVPPDPSTASSTPMVVPSSAHELPSDVPQSPGPPDPVVSSLPPTIQKIIVSAPPVGVLKRGSVRKEPKQVMFSDGIKPGGDLCESPSSSVSTPSQPPESNISSYKHPILAVSSTMSPRQKELQCFLPENDTSSVPPILVDGQMKAVDVETFKNMLLIDATTPVVVAVKKNLSARIKLVQLDCCLRAKAWCFASDGLRNVAQDELLIVVTAADGDQLPPLDVLRYFNALYEDILKGKPMSDMSYGVASQLGIQNSAAGFMGSKDNAGFLHTRPTFQCTKNLMLPEEPYLVGLLIQKIEVPWAKVLPLRLALRLGAETKYYPWSIVSDPFRKPVVAEIGHTVMSVLNDFRNFTYNIAHLAGSWVTLEEEKTVINVPVEQYNQVSKILSSSNEHVLAWATSFCYKADSHLVCVQQADTGSYISQTINKEDGVRRVTGACFVIFNASLKAGGPTVRCSIVEDGVMIQIRPETMEQIREKLHKQQNFKLENESSASPSNSQPCSVEIRWGPMVQAKLKITSPIDGRSLSDAPRYRLYGKIVEASNNFGIIRLVALFILPNENGVVPNEPDDLHTIVKRVSLAVGSTLLPHFAQLNEANVKTLAVRFTLGSDMMDYTVGANGQPLPDNLVPLMDDCLIPVLHNRVGDNRQSLKVELTLKLLFL